MRKSFQFPLLAAMSLVAILAVAACGGSDDDNGGTGGTGGTAGAGGTGGSEPPAPTCDEVCDHVTDDCKLSYPGADPQNPKAKCMEICGQWQQPRILRCMEAVECVPGKDSAAEINACQTYAPCDKACDHLYKECTFETPVLESETGPVSYEDCKRLCPFQTWSNAAIACLGTAECTDGAVKSCFQL